MHVRSDWRCYVKFVCETGGQCQTSKLQVSLPCRTLGGHFKVIMDLTGVALCVHWKLLGLWGLGGLGRICPCEDASTYSKSASTYKLFLATAVAVVIPTQASDYKVKLSNYRLVSKRHRGAEKKTNLSEWLTASEIDLWSCFSAFIAGSIPLRG